MTPTSASILTINGGSSSIRFALYQVGEALERGLHGKPLVPFGPAHEP